MSKSVSILESLHYEATRIAVRDCSNCISRSTIDTLCNHATHTNGHHKLVMGLGENFLTQVRPDQPSLVWVWKISPKNPKFFNLFPRVKAGRVSLLFTVGISMLVLVRNYIPIETKNHSLITGYDF